MSEQCNFAKRFAQGQVRDRLNISLPKALLAHMDAWPEVDWSKVAQDAFMKHLRELRKKLL